jgi:ribonuclease BN (tRNA processing enzyme)
MKIKILGTRGEIEESAPYHSKKSGVLINKTLLLDCGQKSFLDYKPKALLITHLHPDHAYFVRHDEKPSINIPIYAPEGFDELAIHIKKKSFKIGTYTITPIPTLHSAKVQSNAYLIKHKGKKILYTGDMIWIEKKYHKLLKNIDLVITEASFIRKGGMVRKKKETGQIYGHTGVPNSISLFKKFAPKILFMHFGAWFYKNIKQARKKIKKLAEEHNIEIVVGYDGLELTI